MLGANSSTLGHKHTALVVVVVSCCAVRFAVGTEPGLNTEIKVNYLKVKAASLFGGAPRIQGEALGQIFTALTVPALVTSADVGDRFAVWYSMSEIAFGLAAYRANHGIYPSALSDLSPEYLKELGRDLFANNGFTYSRQKEGYLLYSVRKDSVDNGGQMKAHISWTGDYAIDTRNSESERK